MKYHKQAFGEVWREEEHLVLLMGVLFIFLVLMLGVSAEGDLICTNETVLNCSNETVLNCSLWEAVVNQTCINITVSCEPNCSVICINETVVNGTTICYENETVCGNCSNETVLNCSNETVLNCMTWEEVTNQTCESVVVESCVTQDDEDATDEDATDENDSTDEELVSDDFITSSSPSVESSPSPDNINTEDVSTVMEDSLNIQDNEAVGDLGFSENSSYVSENFYSEKTTLFWNKIKSWDGWVKLSDGRTILIIFFGLLLSCVMFLFLFKVHGRARSLRRLDSILDQGWEN